MTSFIDIEEFIRVWDLIDDETTVYIPAIFSTEQKVKQVFFETFTSHDDVPHVVSRVFLSLSEAEIYVKKNGSPTIGLVKIKVSRLYKSFENFFGKKTYGKTFECVLSSMEDDNLKEIDVIWTNKLDG